MREQKRAAKARPRYPGGEARQSGVVRFREGPVHQIVEEGLDELGTQVAVVDVVGVLPHVHAQQGFVAGGQKSILLKKENNVQASKLLLVY